MQPESSFGSKPAAGVNLVRIPERNGGPPESRAKGPDVEKELGMAPEKKGNGGQAKSVLQAQEASVSYRLTHDQIRHRAYQIYLERGAHPGQELDDWLRAERELQRIALFTRDWNRLQQRRYPDSEDGQ